MIRKQERLSYEKRLGDLHLFSLDKTQPRRELINYAYKYLEGRHQEDGARLFLEIFRNHLDTIVM